MEILETNFADKMVKILFSAAEIAAILDSKLPPKVVNQLKALETLLS